MLKKFAILLAISSMALGIVPLAQAQGPYTFTGTVDDSSGCITLNTYGFPTDITAFTVPVTGHYTVAYQSHTWTETLVSYVVAAPFDPTTNLYTQDFQYGAFSTMPPATLSLSAGVTYYMAVSNNALMVDYATCMARTSTDSGTYSIVMTYTGAGEDGESAPGCDQFVPLTGNAAVGTFTDWATLYWSPGEGVSPPMAFAPGQSAWVLGQDESGLYKKVLLSCDFLWVDAGVIGPTYDETWQGAALPVDVVE